MTVAGGSADVIDAVGEGLIAPRRPPAVVQGDYGWDRPADVVGDSYPRPRAQLRPGARRRGTGPRARRSRRTAAAWSPTIRATPASKPVVRRTPAGVSVTASSSQAFTDGFGRWPRGRRRSPRSTVTPSRVGDRILPDAAGPVAGAAIGRARGPRTSQITSPSTKVRLRRRYWRRSTAGGSPEVRGRNPFTGKATVDFGESPRHVAADHRRPATRGQAQPGLRPRGRIDGTPASDPGGPAVDTAAEPDFVFSAQPETRACIATLLGPDCTVNSRSGLRGEDRDRPDLAGPREGGLGARRDRGRRARPAR